MRKPIQLIKKPRTIFISDGEWRHGVTGGVAGGSEAVRRRERETSESQHSAKPRGERDTERVKEEGLRK